MEPVIASLSESVNPAMALPGVTKGFDHGQAGRRPAGGAERETN
jgi:hypothetical protein